MTLLKYRQAKNLTQAEAAEMLRVGIRSIRRWENGGVPTGATMLRIQTVSKGAIKLKDWEKNNGNGAA